jgi:hypothetical protein
VSLLFESQSLRRAVTAIIFAFLVASSDFLHAGPLNVSASGMRLPSANAIYVSPTGNNSNPGTRSQPVQSLEQARNLVRAFFEHSNANITVYLAGGVYRLSSPLRFGLKDSGRDSSRVLWTNLPGTRPVISGAKRVRGWQPMRNSDLNIWEAHVSPGLETRQMFVNGVRASLASGAVPTTLTETASGYTMSSPAMTSWRNPSDIEFVYEQQLGQMVEPICPIASVTRTTITMSQPCWDNSTLRQIPAVTRYWDADLVGGGSLGLPTRVENAFELLTRPGQFYLDSSQHMLYYIPRAGQNIQTADVEVPALQVLVSGSGKGQTPVRNITFSGITFAYTTWVQPSSPQGFSEVQAGFTLTGHDAYAKQGLCDLIPKGTCPYGSWTQEPGAVSFHADAGIVFADDVFTHLGAAGLALGDGSQNDTVSMSDFTDISGNGLEVGGVNEPEATVTKQTRNINVTNNLVELAGVEYPGAVGIFVGYAVDCLISHNQLDNLPYSGISVGWGGWLGKIKKPPEANYSRDNVISNNVVDNFMRVLSDGGGIYTQGVTGTSLANGEKVTGNVVYGQQDWSFALHSDNGAAYITYTGNVLYDDNYEWCCTSIDYIHPSATDGVPNEYPQVFADNYWESGMPTSFARDVTVKGNHLISGPQQAPVGVIQNAGPQPAAAAILRAEAPPGQPPTSPDRVGIVYASGGVGYVTWRPGLSVSAQPVTAYTITACPTLGESVQQPCPDPNPSVTISATEFQLLGYAIVPGLVDGTAYSFSVVASSRAGSSVASDPSATVLAGSDPAAVPNAPAWLRVHVGHGDAALKWGPPKSAGCVGPYWDGVCANPVVAYSITATDGATFSVTGLSQFIVSNGGGHGYMVIGGLSSGSYRFSVTAETPAGDGPSVTSRWVKIPPPPKPPAAPALDVLGAGVLSGSHAHPNTVDHAPLWRTFRFVVRYRVSGSSASAVSGTAGFTRNSLHAHLKLTPGNLPDGSRILGASYKFNNRTWRGRVTIHYSITVGSLHRQGVAFLNVS